jgi:hypothetical protein
MMPVSVFFLLVLTLATGENVAYDARFATVEECLRMEELYRTPGYAEASLGSPLEDSRCVLTLDT